MYLQSFTIKNFRKFGDQDNELQFVSSNKINYQNRDNITQPLVSLSSTLIIGKNNTGKTTITNALSMLSENKLSIKSSDFNLSYLKKLIISYIEAFQNDKNDSQKHLETPKLEFRLKIKLDDLNEDLITNLSEFTPINDFSGNKEIIINATYTLKEEANFLQQVKDLIQNNQITSENSDSGQSEHNIKINNKLLEEICKLLDNRNETEYKLSFTNNLNREVKNFSLRDLLEIKCIKANRHLDENVLSNVFQRIVNSLFTKNIKNNSKELFIDEITVINTTITDTVKNKNDSVSEIIGEIEQSNHIDMKLSGNVSKEDILKKLIKYSFSDGDDYIPEDQFGLGYINLVNIIGEIIYYISSYEENSHRSRINILVIEEPEVFMHPQMQEFFIKRIDSAVNKAIEEIKPDADAADYMSLKCQIIITTHSSHIVNSKIHSSSSFDNINYLTLENKCSKVIPLYDALFIQGFSKKSSQETGQQINHKLDQKDLLFLKKHIKYKVSELFFSDAIIVVEGTTEEILLNYYLEKEKKLRNYYISIFRIDGAYAHIYFPLLQQINIPCVIITDIDIKRNNTEPCESTSSEQIRSLKNRKTTNNTLKILCGIEKLDDNLQYKEINNTYIVFQKDPINEQYATSLEEAIILTNYDNQLVIESLKSTISTEMFNIIMDNNRINPNSSFEIQKKLNTNGGKTKFASTLLYNMITVTANTDPDSSNIIPELPQYITDGFDWLKRQLENDKGK